MRLLEKLTMNSQEMADLVKVKHEAMRNQIRSDLNQSEEVDDPFAYFDKATGQFNLPRHLVYLVVSGFSVSMRERILRRWAYLEEQQLKRNVITTKQNTFLARLEQNRHQAPVGYFSVLDEVHRVFHDFGYSLDDIDPNRHPDNSAGTVFSTYLKNTKNVDLDIITYPHNTGKAIVYPKAYPEEYLHIFLKFLREDWFPKHGSKYVIKKQEAIGHD